MHLGTVDKVAVFGVPANVHPARVDGFVVHVGHWADDGAGDGVLVGYVDDPAPFQGLDGQEFDVLGWLCLEGADLL
ncbi:hypothetical protein ACGFYQ_41505 [Streptomyces sp. NPDC048258]|uniref:hypothetical protein n=1 Tax=Streptomyces sp. NPDC048258 TaxID=3365527 RepID=UPI00372358F3